VDIPLSICMHVYTYIMHVLHTHKSKTESKLPIGCKHGDDRIMVSVPYAVAFISFKIVTIPGVFGKGIAI